MNNNSNKYNNISFVEEASKVEEKRLDSMSSADTTHKYDKLTYALALGPFLISVVLGILIILSSDDIFLKIIGLFIIIIFGGTTGFLAYLGIIGSKKDKNSKTDLFTELQKNFFAEIKQERIQNIGIKKLKIRFIIMVIISSVCFFILGVFKVEREVFFSETLPSLLPFLLFLIVTYIIQVINELTREKRVIKKYNINVLNNVFDIESIKSFNIFDLKSSDYYIVDQNRNLLFKLKNENTRGTKLALCTIENIKIAEIESSFFSNKFIVKQNNASTFIISENEPLSNEWTITGRDYCVTGDCNLNKNMIYDNSNSEIAVISKSAKEHIFYKLHNREVTLNNGIKNSIDIIAIAICITLGNINNERIVRNRNKSNI